MDVPKLFHLCTYLIILVSHETPGLPRSPTESQQAAPLYKTGREEKDAGGEKPVKPERKRRMWWGEQTAASGELPLCVAFFFFFFTASSQPGRIADHISAAGKT